MDKKSNHVSLHSPSLHIDANELSEVQTHHLGGPEELIQKWLCLESHHGLLSSHSPLLTILWVKTVAESFSPSGAGPCPHLVVPEPRHCMVVSPGHLSSKLIIVGITLFSKCTVEAYSWVRYPRLSLSSTRETGASREVFWVKGSMWKELSAACPDTDIHTVTKSQLIWS